MTLAIGPAVAQGKQLYGGFGTTDDNRVVMYDRAANGQLSIIDSVSPAAVASGTDLDAQGPLRLSADHRFLYAVNAGTDDVSVFTVNGANLTLVQRVYAGDEPVSLTLYDKLLYVLDGSVAGNGIRGFSIGSDGQLTELPNSFRDLSSPIAVPGDIEFSPDGRHVLATHKTTDLTVPPFNIIDSFEIAKDGQASVQPERIKSVGLRPFSLTFRSDGIMLVGESSNAHPGLAAASTYRLEADGDASPISGSVRNEQTDTCWEIISKDGQYAYTTNFGTGNISSYRLSQNGRLRLLDGQAPFFGEDSQPVDLDISSDGRYLYQLLRGTGGVATLRIQSDGSLNLLETTVGILPVADGASGLAAY